MRTIYKYPLDIEGVKPGTVISVDMPNYADILSIQEQHGQLVAWALVDTSYETVSKKLTFFFTGQEIPVRMNDGAFVATVQFKGYVLHFYQQKP